MLEKKKRKDEQEVQLKLLKKRSLYNNDHN